MKIRTHGLIACDHCGQVALDTPRYGWRRWSEEIPDDTVVVYRHHCPQAVELNELVRYGLYPPDPNSAVVYGDWDDD